MADKDFKEYAIERPTKSVVVSGDFVLILDGEDSNKPKRIDAIYYATKSAQDAIDSRLTIVEDAQTAGAIGYATKAEMDADTTQQDGTLALVTNDATASNNAWYRWDDSGSSWVKRADFYATTLDPTDSSEAVTGIAVAGYAGTAVSTASNITATNEQGFVGDKEVDYVIVDSADNTLQAFFKDGTHTNYYAGVQDDQTKVASQYPDAEKYALISSDNVSVFQFGSDGNLRIPNLDLDNEIDGVKINSTTDIVCIGDSLTYGTGATDLNGYPYLLGQYYLQSGSNGFRQVTNFGIGGQNGEQIATRMGAYPVMIDLDSDEIPKSGSTNITLDVGSDFLANSVFSFSQDGWLDVGGTLYYGTITRPAGAGSQQYTFLRSMNGTAVTGLTSTYRWIPDLKDDLEKLTILWVGRNDSGASTMADRVVEANRSIINQLPINANYIVMSILNSSSETIGTTDYDYVIEANRQLKIAYPDRFLDIRSVLATEPDGTIPSSLRSDSIHLNDDGYAIVRDEIIDFITQKGF